MNEQQFKQLWSLAYRGEAPAVLAAVDNEPGLVTRGSEDNGFTLLLLACGGGQADLARSLLDRKAEVNQRTNDGRDALMAASVAGHCNVIELLTSRGADIDGRSNPGGTALANAAANDKHPACLCLISKKADLTAVGNNGRSILDLYGLGADPPLSDEVMKQRRESLRAAWAEGPHISQVRRRNWERRYPLIVVMTAFHNQTGVAFRPLAYRQVLMLIANPQLPHNVLIPPLPAGKPEQRRAILHNKIIGVEAGFEGIFKLIVSFL